jgi:methenyltetrahydromethanopterin cyclohydrolase
VNLTAAGEPLTYRASELVTSSRSDAGSVFRHISTSGLVPLAIAVGPNRNLGLLQVREWYDVSVIFSSSSPSQNNGILVDKLVGVGTGRWQTSRCNTPGKNHGRVHYNDGDIIGLIKVEINE